MNGIVVQLLLLFGKLGVYALYYGVLIIIGKWRIAALLIRRDSLNEELKEFERFARSSPELCANSVRNGLVSGAFGRNYGELLDELEELERQIAEREASGQNVSSILRELRDERESARKKADQAEDLMRQLTELDPDSVIAARREKLNTDLALINDALIKLNWHEVSPLSQGSDNGASA